MTEKELTREVTIRLTEKEWAAWCKVGDALERALWGRVDAVAYFLTMVGAIDQHRVIERILHQINVALHRA